jgi:septum formation protein
MSSRPKIVLASQSEARGRMLAAAGISALAHPSGVDELAIKKEFRRDSLAPEMLPLVLAKAKAIAVSARHENALVIGADQILILDNRIFDKPQSLTEARNQLVDLRGRTHRLVSAAAVVRRSEVLWALSDMAELTMRDFSDAFLSDYLSVAGEEALSSVGAYKVESRGIQLFERVSGDYFTVLGLPLLPLLTFLRSAGCLPS